MIKKITLSLLLCCLIVSCGKKDDPEYKDLNEKVKIPSILINRA